MPTMHVRVTEIDQACIRIDEARGIGEAIRVTARFAVVTASTTRQMDQHDLVAEIRTQLARMRLVMEDTDSPEVLYPDVRVVEVRIHPESTR